jgi:hypothetical protein
VDLLSGVSRSLRGAEDSRELSHAKLIDDDFSEWVAMRLGQQKQEHEAKVRPLIGVPRRALPPNLIRSSLTPREYAFAQSLAESFTIHES